MPGHRPLAFLAVLLTALALVPAGAHLLAMPNKLAMGRDAYLAAQAAYAGWAFAGILPIGAILACLGLALRQQQPPHSEGSSPWPALAALLLAAGLAVFFHWTLPANQATANWTRLPEAWEALRADWEWSHAANAVLTFLALCAVLGAAISPVRGSARRSR
jgi:membrane protease YdiL (CAAX protease family)